MLESITKIQQAFTNLLSLKSENIQFKSVFTKFLKTSAMDQSDFIWTLRRTQFEVKNIIFRVKRDLRIITRRITYISVFRNQNFGGHWMGTSDFSIIHRAVNKIKHMKAEEGYFGNNFTFSHRWPHILVYRNISNNSSLWHEIMSSLGLLS